MEYDNMLKENPAINNVKLGSGTKAQGAVSQALSLNDELIRSIDEELHELYGILDAWMVPNSDTRPSDPGEAMSSEISPVAERIFRQAGQLKEMGFALRRLKERLDV